MGLLLSGLCAAASDGDTDKAKKKDRENVGTVIGIDLGTTYTRGRPIGYRLLS